MHLLQTMPVNAATKFAIRTVLREAINKSNAEYKGNINRKNCRYISAAAEEQLTTGSSKSLVADHAIPVSVSLREFEGLEKLSVDAAAAVVAKYAVMTLITAEEDTHLREIGLVKKMPLDWDGSELLARYRFAGILVKPNPSFQPTPNGAAELCR